MLMLTLRNCDDDDMVFGLIPRPRVLVFWVGLFFLKKRGDGFGTVYRLVYCY